jgi:serine/threonine protein kinase
MTAPSFHGYEVEEKIAPGPFGIVYSARALDSRARVAIKLFDQAPRSKELSTVLLNEAVIASAIGHPNIADIVDLGELEDGRPYLIMEALNGEPLASRLRNGRRLPLADAVDFTHQLASALGAAHAEGIAHGALEPNNVFLVPDLSLPRGERVKLLDFGVKSLVPENGVPSPYTAPEQRQPQGDVDDRADVYALGALLHHALCGQPPEGPSCPPVTSRIGNRIGNGELPAHIEKVILRALATNREDRFDSVADLATALSARGATPVRRSWRPLSSAALAVSALAIAVLVPWSGRLPGRTTFARARSMIPGTSRSGTAPLSGPAVSSRPGLVPTKLLIVPLPDRRARGSKALQPSGPRSIQERRRVRRSP